MGMLVLVIDVFIIMGEAVGVVEAGWDVGVGVVVTVGGVEVSDFSSSMSILEMESLSMVVD